jgi:hypothetical protein
MTSKGSIDFFPFGQEKRRSQDSVKASPSDVIVGGLCGAAFGSDEVTDRH